VEAGADEDDMAVDLDAGLGLGRVHVGRSDVAEVGNVLQVEAGGLAHEKIERHFVH
jgi:hypothetical protein